MEGSPRTPIAQSLLRDEIRFLTHEESSLLSPPINLCWLQSRQPPLSLSEILKQLMELDLIASSLTRWMACWANVANFPTLAERLE